MAEALPNSRVCKSYEYCPQDSEGNDIVPFSDELTKSGSIDKRAVGKMGLLQAKGWPEAKDELRDTHGEALIAKKDDVIWLLKCKPSCWRLYFYVREASVETRIIYVLAVCKKKGPENPANAIRARRIADSLRRGEGGIRAFPFPHH